MKWKDYFDFSRSEKNGLVFFAFLLLLIIFLPKIYLFFNSTENVLDPKEFKNDIVAYEKHLKKLKKVQSETKSVNVSELKMEDVFIPFYFNPNNLPKDKWLKLGVPERVARTIKNFEAAGGSFSYKQDLKRVFGFTEQMYDRLESYIKLPDYKDLTDDFKLTEKDEVEDKTQPETEIEAVEIIVDINSADTLELQKLYGIGPFFSQQIVNYRESLGGFYRIEQLLEVRGMDKERFELIKESVFINDTVIKKININNAEFAEMIRHPYFDRNIVNNIIQIRRQHGYFKNSKDIKFSHLIDEEKYELIAPYITVSDK